jgi:hypothetical protein
VPSLDVLEPLGPDTCRSDPSAPCYYLHLKHRALNGDRDKLSARELVSRLAHERSTPVDLERASTERLPTEAVIARPGDDVGPRR